jgi:phosphate starvation-inducible membrane PsiE
MRGVWITGGYLALVALVVASRESFLHNDVAVAVVSGAILLMGLGVWVLVAQNYWEEE